MPLAFVLINAEIGSESTVHETLTQISYVTEAYVVFGVYDIVAKVEADTMTRLKEVITYQIRRLDKVRSTLTMIVMDD
jgi:DNA-binding Lrp family transcriptional regulator